MNHRCMSLLLAATCFGTAKAESTAIGNRLGTLYEKLRPLIPGGESHGVVWVYLRTPNATGKPAAPNR